MGGLQTLKCYFSDCCHRCQLKGEGMQATHHTDVFQQAPSQTRLNLPLSHWWWRWWLGAGGKEGSVIQRQPCFYLFVFKYYFLSIEKLIRAKLFR